MALPQPLLVGDRVRMVRTTNGLTKGMQGTVVRILPNTDCYDVHFENYAWPRLVYRGDLGLVERETAVGLE
jgi:hypothetical protein